MAQTVKKIQQNVKSSETFKWFAIAVLLLILPLFIGWVSNVSLETSRKYADAATNPMMKDVHERHMFEIIAGFLVYNSFLLFYYILGHKILPSLFAIVFYAGNAVISLYIMSIASKSIKKITDAGKKDQYKKYIDLLGTITGFSVVIAFVTILMLFYNLYSLFKKPKKQQQTPQAV